MVWQKNTALGGRSWTGLQDRLSCCQIEMSPSVTQKRNPFTVTILQWFYKKNMGGDFSMNENEYSFKGAKYFRPRHSETEIHL